MEIMDHLSNAGVVPVVVIDNAADTSGMVRGKGRIGIYYLESEANQRPSKVVYDRAWSSIALAKPGSIDWERAIYGVE